MNDPRRTSSSGRTLERAIAVVGDTIERAAHHGEELVAWSRLALGVGFLILWPAVTWYELAAGIASAYAVIVVAILAVAWSVFTVWYLRRRHITTRLVMASVLVDCALVLALFSVYVLRPPALYFGISRVSGLAVIYLVVVGAALRMTRSGAIVSALTIGAGLVPMLYLDNTLNAGRVYNGAPSVVSLCLLLLGAALFGWFSARRTRELTLEAARLTLSGERARARLGAYVSEEVANASMAVDEIPLGGVRQEAAVLFADLRGFTSASEAKEPEQVVSELNEYLEVAVTAVRQSGGVVDKYIGDAVMAVFGVPTPRSDDAACAVRAAAAMELALAELNQRRHARGLPPLRQGIGIHRGVVVAGNIGTVERAQYTVIGDTVNVASRLESHAKELGVTVLLSAAAARGADGAPGVPQLRPLGGVAVKGRVEPIQVFGFA
ncbi:MAG: adenylate/guanylate cyclase domain-containing protein [Deltaproteobacteria bacterium]|nr:adenylate/guanylate cyclase domain-containing protein [Deltaproteobacteria bacterium]